VLERREAIQKLAKRTWLSEVLQQTAHRHEPQGPGVPVPRVQASDAQPASAHPKPTRPNSPSDSGSRSLPKDLTSVSVTLLSGVVLQGFVAPGAG
jgi:hypothetical protein